MTMGIGDKLFLAPIDTDKMHRVLDIGTGTGICTSFRSAGCMINYTDWIMPQGACLWATSIPTQRHVMSI